MPSESSTPVFDPQVVRGLLETFGDPAPVVKVIRLFVKEAPGQVEAVAKGVSRGDQEEVRRAAHSLKSSAASVGARELSALSAKVEELAKAQRMDDVFPLVEPLGNSLAMTSAALGDEAARLVQSGA
jgi:HPt (histidine-containing phosphotransfer) domain-containing protein